MPDAALRDPVVSRIDQIVCDPLDQWSVVGHGRTQPRAPFTLSPNPSNFVYPHIWTIPSRTMSAVISVV